MVFNMDRWNLHRSRNHTASQSLTVSVLNINKEGEMTKIAVKQDENDEVPIEVLATSIRAIAAGIKKLRNGPLGEKALLLLISDNCQKRNSRGYHVKHRVSPGTIKIILDSIESLQSAYFKR